MAMKPCVICGRYTNASRCPACYKLKRAKYQGSYSRERNAWAVRLANGEQITCARCTYPVSAPWDLDHHPTLGLRPAHAACNRAAH